MKDNIKFLRNNGFYVVYFVAALCLEMGGEYYIVYNGITKDIIYFAIAALISFPMMGLIYILYLSLWYYTISEDTIKLKTPLGKIIKSINLNEIIEIGISGTQESIELPKSIFLSKRKLDEYQRRNLLLTGTDGSIYFLEYKSKLLKIIKERMSNLNNPEKRKEMENKKDPQDGLYIEMPFIFIMYGALALNVIRVRNFVHTDQFVGMFLICAGIMMILALLYYRCSKKAVQRKLFYRLCCICSVVPGLFMVGFAIYFKFIL